MTDRQTNAANEARINAAFAVLAPLVEEVEFYSVTDLRVLIARMLEAADAQS